MHWAFVHFDESMSIMKQPEKNLEAFKNLAGSLIPVTEWVKSKFNVRLSPQELAAALTGFDRFSALKRYYEIQPDDLPPHSENCLDEVFAVRSLQKYKEQRQVEYEACLMKLITQFSDSFDASRYPPYDERVFDAILVKTESEPYSSSWFPSSIYACERLKHLPTGFYIDQDLLDGPSTLMRARAIFLDPEYSNCSNYAASVFQFARTCINLVGPKRARESKLWNLEFAADLHDRAFHCDLLKDEWMPFDFLDFIAKEWGYSDFEVYQTEQSTPALANYDMRPLEELGFYGKKLRIKLQCAYLKRYLSRTKLSENQAGAVLNEVESLIGRGGFQVRKPEVLYDRIENPGFKFITLYEPTDRVFTALENFELYGTPVEGEMLILLKNHCVPCLKKYEEKFAKKLIHLCKAWAHGTEEEKKQADIYIPVIGKIGTIEMDMAYIDFLLENQLQNSYYKRAQDQLLKVYSNVTDGKYQFSTSDSAHRFLQLLMEHLKGRKKLKNQIEAIEQASVILRNETIENISTIKKKFAHEMGESAGLRCFADIESAAMPAEKLVIKLGYINAKAACRIAPYIGARK